MLGWEEEVDKLDLQCTVDKLLQSPGWNRYIKFVLSESVASSDGNDKHRNVLWFEEAKPNLIRFLFRHLCTLA